MDLEPLSFEALPSDVVLHTFSFLHPSEIAKLAVVSKRMKYHADNDRIWKEFVMREEEVVEKRNLKVENAPIHASFIDTETVLLVPKAEDLSLRKSLPGDVKNDMATCWNLSSEISWKQLFRLSTKEWRFDPHSKLEFLEILNGNKSIRRDGSKGINPLQLCSRPFTKYRNQITFLIKEIGTWLRIGVVDKRVKLNNGDLIGDQSDCFNLGYCRSGSVSCGTGIKYDVLEDVHQRLEVGHLVTIRWDSANSCFTFLVDNEIRKQVKVNTKDTPVEGVVYPAVQISWHSFISIVDNDSMEIGS